MAVDDAGWRGHRERGGGDGCDGAGHIQRTAARIGKVDDGLVRRKIRAGDRQRRARLSARWRETRDRRRRPGHPEVVRTGAGLTGIRDADLSRRRPGRYRRIDLRRTHAADRRGRQPIEADGVAARRRGEVAACDHDRRALGAVGRREPGDDRRTCGDYRRRGRHRALRRRRGSCR